VSDQPHQPRAHARVRAAIAAPGAPGLLLARTLGSLPVGMVPLGIILVLRAAGRSYALAGIADGAYALGLALAQPLLGRLIDRAGMTRVLAPLALAFPSILVGLTLVGSHGAPAAPTIALALAAGATLPPLGACMRALWPELIATPALRATAFAIDAVLQELAFVLGPPLLTLSVALANPRVGLLAAAGAGGGGSAAFAALARSRHVRSAHGGGGALRSAAVRRLLLLSLALGGSFGAAEVAMPAFCELHGSRPSAGLILAALALGSACGGVVFGARAPAVSVPRRLLAAIGCFAVLLAVLLLAPSIALMAVLAFAAGLPIAPVFAGVYLLLDRFSVAGALTETFAWNTTCIYTGASIGTAAGGALVAPASYRAAIALSVALAVVAAVLVLSYSRGTRLDGAPAHEAAGATV
jgi:MFS family permease